MLSFDPIIKLAQAYRQQQEAQEALWTAQQETKKTRREFQRAAEAACPGLLDLLSLHQIGEGALHLCACAVGEPERYPKAKRWATQIWGLNGEYRRNQRALQND